MISVHTIRHTNKTREVLFEFSMKIQVFYFKIQRNKDLLTFYENVQETNEDNYIFCYDEKLLINILKINAIK